MRSDADTIREHLRARPSTALQIQQALGLDHCRVYAGLVELFDLGLVRINVTRPPTNTTWESME